MTDVVGDVIKTGAALGVKWAPLVGGAVGSALTLSYLPRLGACATRRLARRRRRLTA